MAISRLLSILAVFGVIGAFAVAPGFAFLNPQHNTENTKSEAFPNESHSSNDDSVLLFISPNCPACKFVRLLAEAATAKYGVNVVVYDVSTKEGKAVAQANSVSETPTIIITGAQPARLTGDVSQAQIEAAIKAAIGSSTPTPSPKASATPTSRKTSPVQLVTQSSQDTASGSVQTSRFVDTSQETAGLILIQPVLSDSSDTQATNDSSSTQSPSSASLVLTPTAPSSVATSASTMLAEVSALSRGVSLSIPCVMPAAVVPGISLPAAQSNTSPNVPASVFEFSLLGLGAPILLAGGLYVLLKRI